MPVLRIREQISRLERGGDHDLHRGIAFLHCVSEEENQCLTMPLQRTRQRVLVATHTRGPGR